MADAKLTARLVSLKTAVDRGLQEKARLEGQLDAVKRQLADEGFLSPEDAAEWIGKEESELTVLENQLADRLMKLEEVVREQSA